MRIVTALFIGLLLLPACATVGWDFPADRVGEISLGETSRGELLEMFGQPYQRGLEDGSETWTYVWIKYGPGQTDSKELHIRFRPGGLVDSYSFSSSIPEDADGS